jgi:hypothetical protein
MKGIRERKKESEGLKYERNHSFFNFSEFLHWYVNNKQLP